MTTAQVVETSVTVNNNIPAQDYVQTIFEGVFVFLQTLFFFTCIQFISVFTASANNLFPKFPPPLPSAKKLIQIVRPLEAKEKEDHVVRGFMSLTQLLCVLCGRLHISKTANLATQKVVVVDRWSLWRGSWEGLRWVSSSLVILLLFS